MCAASTGYEHLFKMQKWGVMSYIISISNEVILKKNPDYASLVEIVIFF